MLLDFWMIYFELSLILWIWSRQPGLPDTPSKEKWLNQVLPSGSSVGIDPRLITVTAAKKLGEELGKSGNQVSSISENLVDSIWEDRPARPSNSVFVLDESYSGVSFAKKVENLREQLRKNEITGFVVSQLNDVCCKILFFINDYSVYI